MSKRFCISRKMLFRIMVLIFAISSIALITPTSQVYAAVTTWHVSTYGNDSNAGTSEGQAFRTINKAAQTANAGDTVLIHGGTYRETVRPLRGGGSESTRISYRVDSGETVTVKGSEALTGWSVYSGNVYHTSMSGIDFNGYNPYTIAFEDLYVIETNRTLGQVFSNGVELREVDDIPAVSTTPNSWKATADGLTMYVKLSGANPGSNTMEVTVRKQVFAPSIYNLGYITGNPSLAITTKQKLKIFLVKTSGHRGHLKALRAVKYIEDGSASIMESMAYMILALPYALGGYGLDGAVFNYEIKLNDEAGKRIGQKRCYTDMYYRPAKLVVEYESFAFHNSPAEQGKDVIRAAILDRQGGEVMRLSAIQLYDKEACIGFALNLAYRLGKRI